MWQFTGEIRPPWAEHPGPNDESVWDYPRPPTVVDDKRLVVILDGETELVRSTNAKRVCETASPPTWYLPVSDISLDDLAIVAGSSYCEWKGAARYYALRRDHGGLPVAWDYPEPNSDYLALKDHLGFYPERLVCTVSGQRVTGQGGPFYAGWVTNEIVGPWKGEAGTEAW